MLTAGGIVIAMIARGDADALMHRPAAPSAPAQIVVVAPKAETPGPETHLPAPPPLPPEVARSVAANNETAASKDPAATKKPTAVPGTKPGQIVDLQLWKNRQAQVPATAPVTGAPAPQAAAPTSNAGRPARETAAAPTTHSTVSTPDNDPAVRLARDQLETMFK